MVDTWRQRSLTFCHTSDYGWENEYQMIRNLVLVLGSGSNPYRSRELNSTYSSIQAAGYEAIRTQTQRRDKLLSIKLYFEPLTFERWWWEQQRVIVRWSSSYQARSSDHPWHTELRDLEASPLKDLDILFNHQAKQRLMRRSCACYSPLFDRSSILCLGWTRAMKSLKAEDRILHAYRC